MSISNQSIPVRRSLWSEVDPFFDFFRPPARAALFDPSRKRNRASVWAPAVDLAEDEEAYIVTAELAGASKEDIHIECHDNVLTVKGEKRDAREEESEHRHYVERGFGQFTRSFRLPTDASESVEASYRDGLLTVRVAKQEEKKPKVVAIGD